MITIEFSLITMEWKLKIKNKREQENTTYVDTKQCILKQPMCQWTLFGNSFYQVSNPDNKTKLKSHKQKKSQDNIPYGYSCKIIIKILANQIQKQLKRSIHHDQVRFYHRGSKGCSI